MPVDRLVQVVERGSDQLRRGASDDRRKAMGQYYTPLGIAEFMASLSDLPGTRNVRVLDPGAGAGILGICAARSLLQRGAESVHLIAAPLLAGQLPGDFVGVENHVNVIYGAERDMSPEDATGLATLLNSRLYERFFRTISGNTQVSASEIRGTRFPSRGRIRAAAHRHRAPVASVLHDVPFRCQDRMVA